MVEWKKIIKKGFNPSNKYSIIADIIAIAFMLIILFGSLLILNTVGFFVDRILQYLLITIGIISGIIVNLVMLIYFDSKGLL